VLFKPLHFVSFRRLILLFYDYLFFLRIGVLAKLAAFLPLVSLILAIVLCLEHQLFKIHRRLFTYIPRHPPLLNGVRQIREPLITLLPQTLLNFDMLP
jgi:hypothetical protein